MNLLKLEEQPLLIQAIFSGDIDNVKHVLKEGLTDVNYQDAENRTALHAACFKGDKELVELLISEGARVNTRDSKWLTPLHRACAINADDVVEVLLENKADALARDQLWQNPLHISAANNALECIKFLLKYVANVNVTDRSGCTALHHAALNGHNEVVDLLLLNGSIINACDKNDCRPIHWAAHLEHIDTVKLLIYKGADVNVKDSNHYTPLHAAAANGSVYVCGLLLAAGGDVNAQNSYGNSPLHTSCLNGHLNVCVELLANGADLELVNYKGQTALHIAASSTHGLQCMEYILTRPAIGRLINKQCNDGRTALHMSALYGRFTRSKKLIDEGAVFDCQDKNGRSALHIAAQFGHDILTGALLEYGADPLKRGYEGRTPLHVCCLSGFVEVLRKFIHVKVDLNVVDDTGKTPIHYAAYKGSVECLDLLVSSGANFNLRDSIGRTALHYAALMGHYSCVYTLVGIGSPVNLQDAQSCTALHLAAAYETQGSCVEYLLQHKADPMLADARGFTPVHYAVNGSNVIALRYLLEAVGRDASFAATATMSRNTPLHLAARQADLNVLSLVLPYFPDTNVKNADGCTPLLIAAREGRTHNVQMLLRYGAKVAICEDTCCMSPVHMSAKNGHLFCLTLLMDNAEDKSIVDRQDKLKRTALMLAISGGHQDCAVTLLRAGADPNIVDLDQHNSLFRAVATDQTYMVLFLLDKGADVSVRDVHGKTVIHLAAACGLNNCLQVLKQHADEATIHALDSNDLSALHWSAYKGDPVCLQNLLDNASFRFDDGNCFTPIHCAAFSGSEMCLEILTDHFGAEVVNKRDGRGCTPLHIACWHGHRDCARFLLKRGSEIEAKDDLGRTPLIIAAQSGQCSIIELLISFKANLKACDMNGNTALHVACSKKHSKSALLLLESIDDVETINMVDNQKKTPLHLSAQNGLVDVTRELITKGSSVLALDSNGLTPALCCAPNASVAQCLAIILANHPQYPQSSTTTNAENSNSSTNNVLNNTQVVGKLLKKLPLKSSGRRPKQHHRTATRTNSFSVQTDISLLRNTRELFGDFHSKLRSSPCTRCASIAVQVAASNVSGSSWGSGSGNGSVNRRRPHQYHSSPCLQRQQQRNRSGRTAAVQVIDNPNVLLIENYDRNDLKVDGSHRQRRKRPTHGLHLHRSFSEIALVANKDSEADTEDVPLQDDTSKFKKGESRKESCLALSETDGRPSDAAVETLINGYQSVVKKITEITRKYDVTLDDVDQAYKEHQKLKHQKHRKRFDENSTSVCGHSNEICKILCKNEEISAIEEDANNNSIAIDTCCDVVDDCVVVDGRKNCDCEFVCSKCVLKNSYDVEEKVPSKAKQAPEVEVNDGQMAGENIRKNNKEADSDGDCCSGILKEEASKALKQQKQLKEVNKLVACKLDALQNEVNEQQEDSHSRKLAHDAKDEKEQFAKDNAKFAEEKSKEEEDNKSVNVAVVEKTALEHLNDVAFAEKDCFKAEADVQLKKEQEKLCLSSVTTTVTAVDELRATAPAHCAHLEEKLLLCEEEVGGTDGSGGDNSECSNSSKCDRHSLGHKRKSAKIKRMMNKKNGDDDKCSIS